MYLAVLNSLHNYTKNDTKQCTVDIIIPHHFTTQSHIIFVQTLSLLTFDSPYCNWLAILKIHSSQGLCQVCIP